MPDTGATYAAFVRTELEREYARRDTVNARAATAVTSTTGLVTLVTAAAAVVKGQSHLLHGWSAVWLLVAVLLLLAAAATAVIAGWSWKFDVTDKSTLVGLLGEHWSDSQITALSTVAQFDAKTLLTLRSGTNMKTRWLLATYVLQAAAIAALVSTLIVAVG